MLCRRARIVRIDRRSRRVNRRRDKESDNRRPADAGEAPPRRHVFTRGFEHDFGLRYNGCPPAEVLHGDKSHCAKAYNDHNAVHNIRNCSAFKPARNCKQYDNESANQNTDPERPTGYSTHNGGNDIGFDDVNDEIFGLHTQT